MGNYGFKISKEGKDIYSTNPEDYIYNSKYGSVKIYTEPPNKTYQTITVNANSNATVSIEHGLPFTPLVMWFHEPKPGSGHWYSGTITNVSNDDLTGSIFNQDFALTDSYVDDTYIKVKYVNNTASNLTIKYYYFIFADDGY